MKIAPGILDPRAWEGTAASQSTEEERANMARDIIEVILDFF